MKTNRLLFWARLWLFWLVYFFVHRIVFLAYNYSYYQTYNTSEVIQGFWAALPLDLSTAGYLIALITLMLLVNSISANAFHRLNYVFICLIGIINVSDTLLYHEWGYKLNAYGLSFLRYPKQMLASLTSFQMMMALILEFSLMGFGIVLYKWITSKPSQFTPFRIHQNSYLQSGLLVGITLILASINFLAIRGGLGLAPINQSRVYYSIHQPLNHLATNTAWNLFFSLLKAQKAEKQAAVHYFSDTEVELIFDSLYVCDTTKIEKILRHTRPNVVLVILESWSSDLIKELGGEEGVTPYFSELTKEGLLFDHVYATGDRTDKGVVAVLSAYPAQPISSIIKEPHKVEKLPALPRIFHQKGYATSIYYGGESAYANFKAYWSLAGFERIIDEKNFREEDKNSKWGAHDHVVFDKVIQDLKHQQQPFFVSILTLSSHEPYESPIATPFDTFTDEISKFKKSVYYSDWSLKQFMEQAKKQTWYDQTLFVFVADHGHRFPKDYKDTRASGKYRIPMLFYGNSLLDEVKGKRNHKIASQTDLAATLLGQLNMEYTMFEWSKDLLNPSSKEFAFYAYEEGFTWISDKEQIRYLHATNATSERVQNSQELNYPKAYLQRLLKDYAQK